MDASTSTTSERHAREIVSMPVYSVAEGKFLGNIDRLYVNLNERSVQIVRLGKSLSTWHAFVPFTAIHRLGVDIALVESESVLHDQMTAEDSQILESNLDGRPVVTRSGERYGVVTGFGVEEVTGHIVYLRVERDAGILERLAALGHHPIQIPDGLIQALGHDAIIVQDEVKSLAE